MLSRREAEIAELVGRGLTNRQIAGTAHISERTVETHVQHVLAKLGFNRRAQIVAWVVGVSGRPHLAAARSRAPSLAAASASALFRRRAWAAGWSR